MTHSWRKPMHPDEARAKRAFDEREMLARRDDRKRIDALEAGRYRVPHKADWKAKR